MYVEVGEEDGTSNEVKFNYAQTINMEKKKCLEM